MSNQNGEYPDCSGKPFVDKTGACVEVNISTGFVYIDGIPAFRVVTSNTDGVKIQFADDNKARSRYRGTRFIEIPASVLFEKLITACS